jgi:hypothetical protein
MANRDGSSDLSDAVRILGYLFEGLGSIAGCWDAADANDDGRVDLSDPIAILSNLCVGAEALPELFAACGFDATADVLHCSDPQACEGG